MRTGFANLPLHGGKAPAWLFKRMVPLAGEISSGIINEYGTEEFLRRISNPFWFQALACTLGFDWHSSGTTTTTCGALKMALNHRDLGINIAGGKGKASRKTPQDIENFGEKLSLTSSKINWLIRSSKLAAKVDNSLVQDGYNLYQHTMFFTERGSWAVVQQGMGEKFSRRYHWLENESKSFVETPHDAIIGDRKEDIVLDMTAKESRDARDISLDLVNDGPRHLKRYFSNQSTLEDFSRATKTLHMPGHHAVLDFDISKSGWKILERAYEIQPENYEELISLKGLGPKAIRALALISELIYGESPSWEDPVKYSYAHGGKDGFPYAVDRDNYDNSIWTLKEALENINGPCKEKKNALMRLKNYIQV